MTTPPPDHSPIDDPMPEQEGPTWAERTAAAQVELTSPPIAAAHRELLRWIDSDRLSGYRLRNHQHYPDAAELAASLVKAAARADGELVEGVLLEHVTDTALLEQVQRIAAGVEQLVDAAASARGGATPTPSADDAEPVLTASANAGVDPGDQALAAGDTEPDLTRFSPVWLPVYAGQERSAPPDREVCRRCDGTGAVAASDDAEPWSMWSTLAPPSDLAVRTGLVYPTRCPACGGTGLLVPADV